MNANDKAFEASGIREIAKKLRANSIKDWVEDFNLEFGKTVCKCCICHETFRGFKHRVICKECGDKLSMNSL